MASTKPTTPRIPQQRPVLDRRSKGLRQAASMVFGLTAVLPLLIVTWTLDRLNVLHTSDAQIGLVLAIVVALLGLVVFRRLMAQLSDVILALRALVTKHDGVGVAQKTAAKAENGAAGAAAKRGAPRIPGLGEIGELHDIEATLADRWRTESSHYIGRSVLVYVLNSWTPVVGTLVDVTPDGVLVKHESKEVAIGFRRFIGIKLAEA